MWRRSLNWWWVRASFVVQEGYSWVQQQRYGEKFWKYCKHLCPKWAHYWAFPPNVEVCSCLITASKTERWVLREKFGNPSVDHIPPGKYFIACLQGGNIRRRGFSSVPDIWPIGRVYCTVKSLFPITNIRRGFAVSGVRRWVYILEILVCGDQICTFVQIA